MPSLIQRIGQLFKRDAPPRDTSGDMPKPTPSPTRLADLFTAERERREVVRICNEMYDGDPRCEGAIDTLARDIVRGGVTVAVANNPEAEDVAASLMERIVTDRLDDWVKETLIEGDSFLEMSISGAPRIEDITRKPTLNMHRNSDRTDRFADPSRAFWYDEKTFGLPEPTSDAIWFAEWQIVHARWNHRSKRRYGRPLFASGNGAWKRVREGETDISVRRKTRAGMKFLHVVEGADEPGLEAYKERNRAVLDNPFSAVADLFTNKPGAVQAIQGDARLNDIGDVLHHIETWWTASPVPMTLVGYGKDINRDILEQKLDQYRDALTQLTQWCEDEFVQPIVEREWLLHGIFPASLKVEYAWKAKTSVKARDLKAVADALLTLKAINLPEEVIWMMLSHFLPWLDLSALKGNGGEPADRSPDNETVRLALAALAHES